MKIVGLRFLGRLGNAMFSYAFARAHAELNGAHLCTDPWIGQKIFEIDDPLVPDGLIRRNENTLALTEVNCEIRSYCQQQRCLIYTREQVRRWFKLRPEWAEKLAAMPSHGHNIVAHIRRTDFAGYGYVLPSPWAYRRAVEANGFVDQPFLRISDEDPEKRMPFGFPDNLAMLPDFYRLMTAPVLFRANSTFSWWAATLGNGRVFSPVIDGFTGGQEHDDVPFVEGNHPRLHYLDFTTDLHLRES